MNDSIHSWGVRMLLVLTLGALFYTVSQKWGKLRLPTGPKGLPVLGSTLELKEAPFLHLLLAQWSQKYGDFFSYRAGSKVTIVLSSPEAIQDLIVKKGTKYSSRPPASTQTRLITQDSRVVNMPYGDKWRTHRKVIHDLLGVHNAKIFLPFQDFESRQTLLKLINEPAAFYQEVSRFSGSITFSMLLSCRFEKSDAFIPQQIGHKMSKFFSNIRPGAWLADWLPILDYFPDALAPWRKSAVEIRNDIMFFYFTFYETMRKRVEAGTAPDCFVARLLTEPPQTFTEVDFSHIVAELLTAGTETTATTLQWFFKAAVLFPEPMKTAKEEIDKVVGHDRLPQWSDRPNLPYLAALISELHRWASAAPLAFFHATSDEDEYRTYKVPKDSTVILNTYAIHQAPEYFPEPQNFLPERFLDPDSPLKHHYAFSTGRRECPGRTVAEASLYIAISRILWAFDVSAIPGSPPSSGYSGNFPVYGPAPFQCRIEPRSQRVCDIIREHAEDDRPPGLENSSVYEKALTDGMKKSIT